MTVSNARGYAASVFIYGTYGLLHAAWVNKDRGPYFGDAPQKANTLPDCIIDAQRAKSSILPILPGSNSFSPMEPIYAGEYQPNVARKAFKTSQGAWNHFKSGQTSRCILAKASLTIGDFT